VIVCAVVPACRLTAGPAGLADAAGLPALAPRTPHAGRKTSRVRKVSTRGKAGRIIVPPDKTGTDTGTITGNDEGSLKGPAAPDPDVHCPPKSVVQYQR